MANESQQVEIPDTDLLVFRPDFSDVPAPPAYEAPTIEGAKYQAESGPVGELL